MAVQENRRRVRIFQGNPDRFEIDAYLAASADRITWRVNKYADKIRVGDLVYLWRAAGKKKAVSGIIAAARVDSEVFVDSDEYDAHEYWIEGDPYEKADRVWLRVLRVARPNEVILAQWLKEDPICNGLEVIKQPQGTNYRVADDEAKRIEALWQMSYTPWSYADSIAALKTYSETKGESISRLPGSPVANLALQVGRAVGGAYNKLMNIRALDPTEERKGLSSAATEDKKVWERFFDPATQTLRTDLLEAEYTRLWAAEKPFTDAAAMAVNLERRVEELVQRPLAELEAQWQKRPKKEKPRRLSASTTAFDRDPLVVAIAKQRAGFRCEVPGCTWPGFLRSDGTSFIEVHHIQPLGDGGEDTPENAAAVCPGHHREAHIGDQAGKLKADLTAVRNNV